MRATRGLGAVVMTVLFGIGVALALRWFAPAKPPAFRDVTWRELLVQPSQATAVVRVQPSGDPFAALSDQINTAINDSVQAQRVPAPRQPRIALDGADIRLAGYLIPLEDAPDRAVTEFFLVPYMGACIHVPPPPPDQIVYVKFPRGVRIDSIYEAYRVQGTLHRAMLRTGLADSAYMMVAYTVAPYREP